MGFSLGAAVTNAMPDTAPTGGAAWVVNQTVIETFLARVLPPPGQNRVISIHTMFTRDDGQRSMPGNGFDSVARAANHIAYRLSLDISKGGKPATDYWYCLSVQSGAVAGQTKTGRPTVRTSRRQANAVALKTFFLDLDVKPKAYASKQAALSDLIRVVKAGNAPTPTMVVDSGNGLHVYWTLDTEVPAKEWQEVAEGFGNHLLLQGMKLEADTFWSDSCRVLRPPGTYNCKNPDSPILTRIVGTPLPNDYPLATFLPWRNTKRPAHVASVTRMPGTVATGPSSPASSRVDVSALVGAGGSMPVTNDMAAGVAESQAQPVNMARVAEQCEVLKDVLARGGNGDSEPFWRLNLYAASFAPDGREWAHKFSKGDPRYSESDTDAKLATIMAQRQRAQGKHGWPSCAEFNKYSPACGNCQFAGRVKSPMHTGRDDSDLPQGYYRQGGTIWKNLLLSARKDAEPIPTEVFAYGIRDAYIESSLEGQQLNAEVHVRGNQAQRLRLPLRDISVWRDRVLTAMAAVGITVSKHISSETQEFFVEFVRQLQQTAAVAARRESFGWTRTRNGAPGFGIGTRIYRADGGYESCGGSDVVLEDRFTPHGAFDPWRLACDHITGSGRLDLQAIVAGAFAAPLVRFTGQAGLLVSAYSPQSGVQKSSAMRVAQAVWGHPRTAMNRIDDTGNSVAHKLGTIRHLPVMWDELNVDSDKDTFARLAFVLTQGTEKSRLTADITQRQGGSWATMLVSAGNFSVQDEMVRKARNTTAGLNRVLEFVVRPASAGQLRTMTDASMVNGALDSHYGHAGMRYAIVLAREEQKLAKHVAAVASMVEKQTGATPEERFWVFSVATLLLGATIAAAEGIATFDLPGLRDYLLGVLREQRAAKRSASPDAVGATFAADVLIRYIQHTRQRNTCLETDGMLPAGLRGGRPAPLQLMMPSDEARRSLRAPVAHIARHANRVRLLKHEFHEWLTEAHQPVRAAIDALTQHGGLSQHRVTWAAGTEYASGQALVYDIELTGSAVGGYFDLGPPPAGTPLPGPPPLPTTSAAAKP